MSDDTVTEAHAHFWTLAEGWLERDGVAKATMMGFPCLRYDGTFFAAVQHKGTGLIVKLPRERVAEAITADEGEPFAPAGKVFKEWMRVPYAQRGRWNDWLGEAFVFAGGTL